jgi:uncharacterized membrane protein YidH (DUF202 family)
MKKIGFLVGSSAMLALPFLASALGLATSGSGGGFGDLLGNILEFVNGSVIPFIIGIGFLTFVFGMFQFFIAGGANEEKKEKGKSLMIYATLGFVLIIVFWGIINLLASTTGFEGKTIEDIPTVNTIKS